MKGITSPEGLIMLIVAGIFDATGFIIFILGTWFGIDDYGILEILGIVVFGLWMFIRYGSLGSEGGMKTKPQKDEKPEEEEEEGKENQDATDKNGAEKDGEGKEKSKDSAKEETPQKDETAKSETPTKSAGEPATPGDSKLSEKSSANPPTGEQKGDGSKKPGGDTPSSTPGSKAVRAGTPSAQEVYGALKTGDVKGLAKKAFKRFFWALLIELVPFVGGFLPWWTVFVWKEMKEEPPEIMPKQETPKKSKAAQAGEREPQYSSKA